MKKEIETVDELCEYLADSIGIYGCCKAMDEDNGGNGQCENENLFCCRTGFTIALRERIINAVEIDELVSRHELCANSSNYDKLLLKFLTDR